MTDEGFLDKIDCPFICLTAAILCHSLRCWWTSICIDNVAFTRATSAGKKNNVYWQVSKVFGSPDSPWHPDTFENSKYSSWVKGRLMDR